MRLPIDLEPLLGSTGSYGAKALNVPACVTLVPLPPRSLELNPAVRVWLYLWLYLKDRDLCHRLHDDYDAVVGATCETWRRLIEKDGRLTSRTSCPWIEDRVMNQVRRITRPQGQPTRCGRSGPVMLSRPECQEPRKDAS